MCRAKMPCPLTLLPGGRLVTPESPELRGALFRGAGVVVVGCRALGGRRRQVLQTFGKRGASRGHAGRLPSRGSLN